MQDPTALLEALVAIDSVNPALVPGGAGEGAIAAFVADWATAAGLNVSIIEPVAGRPSVVAVARGTGGGQSLLLNAHLDTVGVAGMAAPFTPRVSDGRLYGRGAFDMKAGLAAAMVATAAARTQGLAGDVILAAVADEEHGSIGTAAILETVHADAAIVTEPTDFDLSIAHKGFVWFEVETTGVAAHGSRPDLGVDAIAKMGRVLVGLEALDQALRAGPAHPLLGTGSVHASLIEGGQERSSYPYQCRLDGERRTVPGEDVGVVTRQLQAMLHQAAAADPALHAKLTIGLTREPFAVAPDAAIVHLVRRQAAARLGHPPALTGETGWMDAALLDAAGIPTVIFGPRGDGAHATVEWVDLASVTTCAEILLATAIAFCG